MIDSGEGLFHEPLAAPKDSHRAAHGEATSDQSLLRDCGQGCDDAAAQLYHRYHGRLAQLVRTRCSTQLGARLDVEDIVQSAFASFFRGAGSGLYEAPDGQDLWRLLATIALNKVRARAAFHRAGKRDVRQTRNLGFDDPSPDALTRRGPSTDHLLRLAIDEALDQLPAQQRDVVELRLQGYEVGEISARVGRAKRTVERSLQQATAFLRTLF